MKTQTTKLNQDKMDDMNNPLATEEIELIIEKKKKSLGPDGFTGEFKEELTPILHNFFQKTAKEGTVVN